MREPGHSTRRSTTPIVTTAKTPTKSSTVEWSVRVWSRPYSPLSTAIATQTGRLRTKTQALHSRRDDVGDAAARLEQKLTRGRRRGSARRRRRRAARGGGASPALGRLPFDRACRRRQCERVRERQRHLADPDHRDSRVGRPARPRDRVGEPYGHWTFALHTLSPCWPVPHCSDPTASRGR